MRNLIVLLVVCASASAIARPTSAPVKPRPLPAITEPFRTTATLRLERVLGDYGWRHDAEITAVTFSPDGDKIVTAGGDHRLRVWDATTGEAVAQLSNVKGRIYTVAYVGDSATILTTSSNGTLALWDAGAPDAPPRILAGHSGAVIAADVSSDGQRIVSASKDHTLKLWNATTGAEVATYPLPVPDADAGPAVAPTPVQVAFAGAGNDLLVVTTEGTLLVMNNGNVRKSQPRNLNVDAAAFSRDRRLLAIAAGGTLHIYEVGSGDERAAVPSPAVVDEIDFDAGGKRVAAVGRDGVLAMWSVSGTLLWRTQAHAVEVCSAAFSPDDKRLVTASRDNTFRLWDTERHAPLTLARGHSRPVLGVAFAGDSIISGGADGIVRVWDRHGEERHALAGTVGPVFGVAAHDGTALSAGDDGKLRFWDLARGKELAAVAAHAGGAFAVAVSADGKHAISGGRDGNVRVWLLADHHRLGAFPSHSSQIDAVALSPDGAHGLAGDDDGRVRALDVARLHEGDRLPNHDGPVLAVAVTTDGKFISGSEDGTIRIVDRSPPRKHEHARKPQLLTAHTAAVTALAVCPDGSCLISGSKDGMVIVWSLSDGAATPIDRIDLTTTSDVPLALAVGGGHTLEIAVGTRRGVVLVFERTPPRPPEKK